MPSSKRRVVYSDSDSEGDFLSRDAKIRPPKPRSKEPQVTELIDSKPSNRKRVSQQSRRRIPTFEEGEAIEELLPSRSAEKTLSSRQPAKRRKSLFPPDLGDPEDGPRGKVQLTVEECLRKSVGAKINVGSAPKPSKTLHHYFGLPGCTATTPSLSKRAVNVDEFFSTLKPVKLSPSTSSTLTPRQVVTLVAETPESTKPVLDESDEDICLSTSVNAKSLVPSPSAVLSGVKMATWEDVKRTPSSKKTTPELCLTNTSKKDSLLTPKSKENQTNSRGNLNGTEKPISPQPTPKTPKSPLQSPKAAPSTVVNRSSYWAFQSREGPSALGTKPIPQHTSACFTGKTFVLTGVLECMERDEAQQVVERGGGRVTKSLSKKTTYLVVGRDCGSSKLDKAAALGVKQISEDEFFDLVYAGFGKPKTGSTEAAELDAPPSPPPTLTDRPIIPKTSLGLKMTGLSTAGPCDTQLWVEKYRPTSRKQLVGQNGAASPANKLFAWLQAWQADFSSGAKAKAYSSAPPWASTGGSGDAGSWARAALLSGPPGIGKTTTAMAVCRELGFATIEMNASDTRSKRSMQEEVSEAMGMRSLANMLGYAKDSSNGILTSHVLIMDEVDGMAGNEDRGGMHELIGIIKSSKVPVICLCNDRQSAKVRSLANCCLDLRFHRPRVEQIKAAILTMACREGVSIGSSALNEIIAASNQDLRQVINSVQMWCMGDSKAQECEITAGAAASHKNLRLGAFEVIRKVFSPDVSGHHRGTNGMPTTFSDSMDLFFHDYSIGPLFVQENYLHVRPLAAKGDVQKTLDLLCRASEDIAMGDIVGKKIQSTGAAGWSLLPTQGVFASLRPGRFLRGPLPGGPGGVAFPSWFGKNSTQGKNSRLLGELSRHVRLSTHGGATDPRCLLMDYLTPLAVRLSAPLKEGDINKVLETLDAYQLLREDMDNIMELTTWQGLPSAMKSIDPKTKAALTRTYNKKAHPVPYATRITSDSGHSGAKRRRWGNEEAGEGREEEEANQLLGNEAAREGGSDSDDLAEVQKMAKKPSKKPPATMDKVEKPKKSRAKKESAGNGTRRTRGKEVD